MESNSYPSASAVSTPIATRCHRIRKDKKLGPLAAARSEAQYELSEYMLKHRFQPLTADVARRRPIECVADCHIVCGDGLCHGARGSADVEEPARHFLTRADFGEYAIGQRIEIDGERLLLSAGAKIIHDAPPLVYS